jgi:NAD(P)H-quinone oxidoreductase subunit 4
MLREVFYGDRNTKLDLDRFSADAQPREIFIATCLLIPIIPNGLYPKLATNTYDVKTVEVASKVRDALPIVAKQETSHLNAQLISAWQSPALIAPEILGTRN